MNFETTSNKLKETAHHKKSDQKIPLLNQLLTGVNKMTGNKQIVNSKRRANAAWEGRISDDSLTPFEKELLEVIDSLEAEAEELRELANNKTEANK